MEKILKRIRYAESIYQRPLDSVQLLVVSKGQDIEAIKMLATNGQKDFGENYLQEALEKIRVLSALDLDWHFIGNLQANKTQAVAENFFWVHSVNRFKIAERLSWQRPEDLPPLNICLEVNISGEPSKSGVAIDALFDLALRVQGLPRLRLRGLMAIPEPLTSFHEQEVVYKKVYNLQQQLIQRGLRLDILSMGMSNDFEAAIAAGSNLVRIGTAIFRD